MTSCVRGGAQHDPPSRIRCCSLSGGNAGRDPVDGDEMSEIDPEKLEEALAFYGNGSANSPKFDVIHAAARAHLATLPRYKEVEVEGWMVINSHGVPVCAHQHEMAARNYLEHGGVPGDRIVRLTGTAKVEVA